MTRRFNFKPTIANVPKKPRAKPVLREEGDQIAAMDWLAATHYELWKRTHHSPNGGKRHIQTAKRMRRLGTKAGFPDLVMYVPRGAFHGLVIEVKYGKGKETEDQSDWLEYFHSLGYMVAICTGYEAVVDTFKAYIALPARRLSK